MMEYHLTITALIPAAWVTKAPHTAPCLLVPWVARGAWLQKEWPRQAQMYQDLSLTCIPPPLKFYSVFECSLRCLPKLCFTWATVMIQQVGSEVEPFWNCAKKSPFSCRISICGHQPYHSFLWTHSLLPSFNLLFSETQPRILWTRCFLLRTIWWSYLTL